ncbi:hypothetical protein ACTFIZ_010362 [Dictyostelium cf. discoideum]
MIKNYSILFKIIEINKELKLNENNFNDENFFKIWKNNYLKFKILNYLKIYQESFKSIFYNCQDFIKFEKKEFIKHLIICFNDPLKLYFNKIPNSITNLELVGKFNQQLRENQIPSTITRLRFGNDFNQSIKKKGIIPSSVTNLIFDSKFNKPLSSDSLPTSVKSLEFNSFNQVINFGDIPFGVKNIKFGYPFNRSLNNLPNSIESLTIMQCYERKIELGHCLSLTELNFTHYNRFNEVIEPGDLPITLKKLSLGCLFNKLLIHGSLPPQLEYLNLGEQFNQPLQEGILPNSIKTLYLGVKFSQVLKAFHLPKSLTNLIGIGNLKLQSPIILNELTQLTQLDIGNYNHQIEENYLPKNLKSLNLGSLNQPLIPNSLPNSITFLDMGKSYNHELDNNILPKSLNHLIFSNQFKKSLGISSCSGSCSGDDGGGGSSCGIGDCDFNVKHPIPINCSILEFSGNLHSNLIFGKDIIIPSSIRKLKTYLPNSECMKVGSIPSTVIDLFLNGSLPKQIPIDMLPKSITTLHIDFYSYHLSPGIIPNSVLNLSFGFFNQPLFENSIPSSVVTLNLGKYFNHSISSKNIPSSIRTLKLGSNFNHSIDIFNITHLTIPSHYKYKLKQLNLPNLISVTFLYDPN